MNVLNIHEREFDLSALEVGALIDSLASPRDMLWPHDRWPPMRFDKPLAVGARGGHGPIRYAIEEYVPGKSIKFRFLRPAGFEGYHTLEVIKDLRKNVALRHTLKMNTAGLSVISWPLVFHPLHDALVEDALARAQASLGQQPTIRRWSLWVRLLRWLLSSGLSRGA